MSRNIEAIAATCRVDSPNLPADLRTWIAEQAQEQGLRWLLAYTDSGVIWGELRAGTLHLSSDAYPRTSLALQPATLQQAHIFGEAGELLLWRGPNEQWRTTLRRDGAGEVSRYFDEDYCLWGSSAERAASNGFRELREGSQGIVHAPPLERLPTEKKRARLAMRHYLAHDETGVVRIVASRMLKLCEAEE
jgi:CRISPR-associated protein (TIGR03984 family)